MNTCRLSSDCLTIVRAAFEGSNAGTPKMNINPGGGTGDVWTSVFFQHYQPKFIEIVHLKTEFHSSYGIGKVLVEDSALHHEEFAKAWTCSTSFPAVHSSLSGYSSNSKMEKNVFQTAFTMLYICTIICATSLSSISPYFIPSSSVCSKVRCRRWRVQRHHHRFKGTIQAALQRLSVALNELHR